MEIPKQCFVIVPIKMDMTLYTTISCILAFSSYFNRKQQFKAIKYWGKVYLYLCKLLGPVVFSN